MAALNSDLLAELNQAIVNRWLQSVAREIRDNAAPCLAIVDKGEDHYTSVGNTRFGGEPDLPPDVTWPTDPDSAATRYSNFVVQINFAEIPHLAEDDVLPKSGVLYIFVRSMESAADPVLIDAVFFDGDCSTLQRRRSPSDDFLCDEYLVDLIPRKVAMIPCVSVANYRKAFRRHVKDNTQEVGGDTGELRRIYLSSDLSRQGQIGQLLGFANAGDERDNLYRQVVLGRLDKRELMFNDYWDSMAEYEACIEKWRHEPQIVRQYRKMRNGVVWLTSNRDMISNLVDEWRLLLRLDSNAAMNLWINDADPLYVFIRHEDLARRDFSNLAGEVTQG